MTAVPSTIPDLTLRLEQCGSQTVGSSLRLIGLVRLKHIVRVIEALDLEANPRDSRIGTITDAIKDTLEKTPELFPVKSKGILMAASQFSELDRNRYELTFVNRRAEGIMDGGHNLLAIGTFILERALDDADALKQLRKCKIWSDFKLLFMEHIDEVKAYIADPDSAEEVNTLVPLELIVPKSIDPLDLEGFNSALLEIQEARNNNAQLRQETKTNAAGLYDSLRECMPEPLRERIEWKANEGGDLRVADIIAMTWIPLAATKLTPKDEDGKEVTSPSPVQSYSSKGECVKRYDAFMSSDEITVGVGNTPQRELRNPIVLSAFKIAGDLPALHDYLYAQFPALYNSHDGRFGGISAVAKMNNKKGAKTAKYFGASVDVTYPEGFIAPLL